MRTTRLAAALAGIALTGAFAGTATAAEPEPGLGAVQGGNPDQTTPGGQPAGQTATVAGTGPVVELGDESDDGPAPDKDWISKVHTVTEPVYIAYWNLKNEFRRLAREREAQRPDCTNHGKALRPQDEVIVGTEGDDDIVCETLKHARRIQGLAGNDRITVKARTAEGVIIDGGDGDDTIAAQEMRGTSYRAGSGWHFRSAQINGGGGNDTISAQSMQGTYGAPATINGDAGADTLTVYGTIRSNAEANGGEGNDTIAVHDVRGRVDAGAGDDRLKLDRVSGVVYAGAGDDVVTGNSRSTMYPYPGSLVDGGDGYDTCHHSRPSVSEGGSTLNPIGTVTGFENTPEP